MYRIREERGRKKTEKIELGSVVKYAKNGVLYKVLHVAKNVKNCDYEVVLMAMSADFSVYTVPVDLFLKEAGHKSKQLYMYEVCGYVDGKWEPVM